MFPVKLCSLENANIYHFWISYDRVIDELHEGVGGVTSPELTTLQI